MAHSYIYRSKQAFIVVGLVVLGFLSAPQHAGAQADAQRETINVLFIGNSYTYYNNLGDIIAGIAESQPGGPLVTPTLALSGGKNLRWHLENGTALSKLESGAWDFVVLQDHSLIGGEIVDRSATAGDPEELFYPAAREWVAKVRAVGADPVLYMTWARRFGPRNGGEFLETVSGAYLKMGAELDVAVAPVGLAFAESYRRLQTLPLHHWDETHPSAAGSYLAGLVFYQTLTGRRPIDAPSLVYGSPVMLGDDDMVIPDRSLTVPLVDLREATAMELQKAAAEVISITKH